MTRRAVPWVVFAAAAVVWCGAAGLLPCDGFRASLAYGTAAIDGPPLGAPPALIAGWQAGAVPAFIPPRKWRRDPVAWRAVGSSASADRTDCLVDEPNHCLCFPAGARVVAQAGDGRGGLRSARKGPEPAAGGTVARLAGTLVISRPPPGPGRESSFA